MQSRQCQRFCGSSGLFSARTPLSSILKRRCCANLYDEAAAKPHAAAPRAVQDPSASHKAPGPSDRLRPREDQSHPPEDQGDRGGRVRRIKAGVQERCPPGARSVPLALEAGIPERRRFGETAPDRGKNASGSKFPAFG